MMGRTEGARALPTGRWEADTLESTGVDFPGSPIFFSLLGFTVQTKRDPA